jgi:hypothetical protein
MPCMIHYTKQERFFMAVPIDDQDTFDSRL